MDMAVQLDDTGQLAMVTDGASTERGFWAAEAFARPGATISLVDNAQPRIQASKRGRHL